MDERSDFGAFFAGLIIGGLVGAAMALLMAPQSGEETRIYIRDKGIELKDKASETAEIARERAEELAQKSTEAIGTSKAKVQEAVGTGKTKMQDAVSSIQKKASDGSQEETTAE